VQGEKPEGSRSQERPKTQVRLGTIAVDQNEAAKNEEEFNEKITVFKK
jgi:hypothetical protein